MSQASHQTNGQSRVKRPSVQQATSFSSVIRVAKKALTNLDVEGAIKKYPGPIVAGVAIAGITLGLTIGSKAVRILISSVGMYTVSEVLRRYAQEAVADFDTKETITAQGRD